MKSYSKRTTNECRDANGVAETTMFIIREMISMNKKYKRNSKSLALLLSICLAILLIAIAVIIRFYSIRVLLTALVCAIIPFAFITIYTIMGAGDYIEIHDDFFVFKQGRNSPRKVYWKEISGLAFSGNKHSLPFSVMNVFEETGNMEPQTIVLLDSTYEQYKKMWEDMILSYTKSQPESHNIDAKFGEFLNL